MAFKMPKTAMYLNKLSSVPFWSSCNKSSFSNIAAPRAQAWRKILVGAIALCNQSLLCFSFVLFHRSVFNTFIPYTG